MVFQPQLSLVVEGLEGRAPLGFVVRQRHFGELFSRDDASAVESLGAELNAGSVEIAVERLRLGEGEPQVTCNTAVTAWQVEDSANIVRPGEGKAVQNGLKRTFADAVVPIRA